MEAVSRGAAEAGAKVIGVVANSFPGKANRWVQEIIVVKKWEERLLKLIALGDGYVACPGSTGTLVELAVAWEMMSKGLLPRKPLVALGEFWRPVVETVQAAEPGKPMGSGTGRLVQWAESVPAAVQILQRSLSENRSPQD